MLKEFGISMQLIELNEMFLNETCSGVSVGECA
jgi:hypothetical protein